MSLEVKRVLFVLMPHDYQDVEFTEPYNMIQGAGHNVEVAGFKQAPHIGTQGHKQMPDLQFLDLTISDFENYDALVIPGGKASPQYLWNNERLQDVVRYFHDQKKLVATICYACIVPVQAGILENKNATVYPTDEAKSILKEHNVTFVDEECVVLPHDKIITAQGPKFAQTFGKAILNMLN